jgi:cysteine desulfurase family protein
MDHLYLDNAATGWPKPEATLQAMIAYQRDSGGSPGRSGHRLSLDAGRIVYRTREALAQLFHCEDPLRIVFAKNATEALNIVFEGLLKTGDQVVTTAMEHNAVMRPLRDLETRGVEVAVAPCSPQGMPDLQRLREALTPRTRLVVATHASNVTGTIMPLAEISRLAREKGIPFCVDAAQTAGAVPIDVEALAIDLLAFTGHKSLLGPQGTGGLFIREGLEERIAPLMRGGTGSRSEFEEQPLFMPDKFECGTPNTIGLAGLGAGVRTVLGQGPDRIRQREEVLTQRLLDRLSRLDGVTLYGPPAGTSRIPVVSFNLAGLTPSDVALLLEEKFGILSRPGLHCSPAAHRTIGTFPQGTIRFSFGFFTTEADVDRAAAAVEAIRREHPLK